MKLKSIFVIAFDACITKKRIFAVSVAVMIIMFVLISVVSTMYIETSYYETSLKKALPTTVDKVGYANNSRGDADLLAKQIKNIEGVTAVASWSCGIKAIKGFEKIYKIQKGHEMLEYEVDQSVIEDNEMLQENMSNNSSHIEITEMHINGWDFYNWNLMEGEKPEGSLIDDYTKLVYLGYKYKDVVNVGDIIEDKISEDITYRYIISGIIEKGELIADDEMGQEGPGKIQGSYSLDYGVIQIGNLNSSTSYFVVDESHDINSIIDEIYELSEGSEGVLNAGTMEKILSYNKNFQKQLKEYILELSLVIALTAFVIIVCSQVISILSESKIYGIWYSNGATTSELLKALLFENIIKVTVAIILSVPCAYCLMCRLTSFGADRGISYEIFASTILVEMVVIGYGLAILSSIIPMIIFAKKTPVSMLGGE